MLQASAGPRFRLMSKACFLALAIYSCREYLHLLNIGPSNIMQVHSVPSFHSNGSRIEAAREVEFDTNGSRDEEFRNVEMAKSAVLTESTELPRKVIVKSPSGHPSNIRPANGTCCVTNSWGEHACLPAGTRLAFRDNALCERGTSGAVFDYMDSFERLLCGEAWVSSQDSDALCKLWNGVSSAPRFRERFGKRIFVTDRWWSTVDADLKREGIGTLYQIMAGDPPATGTRPKCARNVVHAVFDASSPHGDGFAAISPVLPTRAPVPVVLHIVRPSLSNVGSLHSELGIEAGDTVFCRHGGFDTFNILFVREAICQLIGEFVQNGVPSPSRPWFLFLGTEPIACASGIIEAFGRIRMLPATTDSKQKSRFINTCNACMHARQGGETFGLSVAECAVAGLPVLTYTGKDVGDNYHLRALGSFALGYQNRAEFQEIIRKFDQPFHRAMATKYQNLYQNSSEENVMVSFVRAFQPSLPPKC